MFKKLLSLLFVVLISCSVIMAQEEGEEEGAAPKEEAKSADTGKKAAGVISVTEVKVEEDSEGEAKGIAEIVINGVVKIKDIRVEKSGTIKFPAYVSRGGREYPQFEPLTKQAKDEISKAIKSKKPSATKVNAISYKITDFKSLKSKSRKVNAKVSLNNSVEISCGVMEGRKGPWIAWPAAKNEGTGKYDKQVIFINKKLKDTIEKALISKYEGSKGGGGSEDEEE